MPEKSSNSVKVFFADKEKLLKELKEYAERVKAEYCAVERVGLFGSYATDNYGPASDADILIILRQSADRFIDRTARFMPDNLSVGCDVFAYTNDEIESMKKQNNPWITHILKEVLWL